jgi:hypothetical protein
VGAPVDDSRFESEDFVEGFRRLGGKDGARGEGSDETEDDGARSFAGYTFDREGNSTGDMRFGHWR